MESKIKKILEEYKEGIKDIQNATNDIKSLYYKDIGYAVIDTHREVRVGYPEIIYCEHKTVKQIKGIISEMNRRDSNILATRASEDLYKAIRKDFPLAKYYSLARIIFIKKKQPGRTKTYIAVVGAGTSDLAVIEEAYITARLLGNKTIKIVDVGISGIHRLLDKIELIRGAKVVIVVAGMEGALPSVIAGLIDKPVIAVPTSIGYGANFKGIAPLLTMLNSCANGVSVVNIDNGFGAAYQASIINKL